MSDSETGDAYQFEFVSIDGDKLPLAEWRGRPVLVANTASFCGYTPQYRELEALLRGHPPHPPCLDGGAATEFAPPGRGSGGRPPTFRCSQRTGGFARTR